MANAAEQERRDIISELEKEYGSYGTGYKPDIRMARETYRYMPQEYSGVITENKPEYTDTERVPSQADVDRMKIQDAFLTKLLNEGDRRGAIEIALKSEKNNIGIPISYFQDMLMRDKLFRKAYELDNPEYAKAAYGPVGYSAFDEKKMVESPNPMQKRERQLEQDRLRLEEKARQQGITGREKPSIVERLLPMAPKVLGGGGLPGRPLK